MPLVDSYRSYRRDCRFFVAPLVIAALVVAAGGGSRGEDWPTYRHDNDRSGATAESITLPLRPVWTYRSPRAPKMAWAGPERRVIEGQELRQRVAYDDALQVSVVGDRAYFGSSVDHQVHCVEAATGKRIWTCFTGGPVRLAVRFRRRVRVLS